jgi:hypothetical protein
MKVFICSIVLLAGCASAAEVLPRVESGLVAAKADYVAVCEPPPAGAEKVCADIKIALDDAAKVAVEVGKAVAAQ